MHDLTLLGFCVDDDYFLKYSKGDAMPQVAAHKLESRFLEAISGVGVEVVALSTMASSAYPRNPHVFMPAARTRQAGVVRRVMPLINLPGLKLIVRFVMALCGLFSSGKPRMGVCVYAAHTPNLLAAWIFSRLRRVPYYVYVPDLPAYMDVMLKRSRFVRLMKQIDASILGFLVRGAAGLFVISRPMVDDCPQWSNVPFMVLEGIADTAEPPIQDQVIEKKRVFYAGGVNRSYGIEELVEGFLRSGIDYELHICGGGDLVEYLKSVSAANPSVKYWGVVSPAEVAKMQAFASVLPITRDPAQTFTRYSFPSKLIEYMCAEVPVLTTRLKGIPDEYYQYLNIIPEFSVEGVASALREFASADPEQLSQKANRGRVWLLETRSSQAVGNQILKFMEKFK
ncbi:glycosyltransferase [Pseudomonas putida]|uniref:glycosyltransferase n=1 Tax=Pseudomonas putida TaxID=303 RepID=UPI00081951F5|nr:glycosyltransferase [Pseudomonas putida]OCT25893.1 hypothetical protein A6E24_12410 [Pseudomonas putida]OCT27816.1 hypothetical protein A6E23_08845 [Pseudomonas putida]OCT32315.1 hypothetical protein A6E20_01635 [Pseudomonas putida]OCT38815.1 hypothetical protein A6E19_10865 [Pseudomonas putida]